MSDGTDVAVRPERPMSAARENFQVVARRAEAMARSTVIPKEYQGSPENVLVALDMADRTGMPALTVMQNLHIINGRPSWSAQFLIAAVNRSGRFSPLRFRFQGTEGKDDWGCRAVARDLDDGEELVGALITIGMAKEEGWATKSGSKWKTMPEQMLRYRSAAFWARVYSPELAVGLHTEDEAEDIGPSPKDRVKELAAALDSPEQDGDEVVDAEVVGDQTASEYECKELDELLTKAARASLLSGAESERWMGAIERTDGDLVRDGIKTLALRLQKALVGGPEEQKRLPV